MPEGIKIKQTVFHNDDLKLTLEYPENTETFSSLGADDFAGQVEIFARILFEHIATNNKKSFRIMKNDETGLYEYFLNAGT